MTPPCILAADDNSQVRMLLGEMFKTHGFSVLLAASGEEAVALYRRHAAAIALVLLDVRMPGSLDGPNTLAVLQSINPRVRCFFMSGETGIYQPTDLIRAGALDVIRKPFSDLRKLLGLISQAIETGRSVPVQALPTPRSEAHGTTG